MKEIRLSELLGALSHALDMTEGQPAGHCVRCCWIGIHVGREIGLDRSADLGALLHAAAEGPRLQQQCGAHLPAVPRPTTLRSSATSRPIDGSLPQALRFVLSHTGLKSGLAERFRALVNIFRNGGEDRAAS